MTFTVLPPILNTKYEVQMTKYKRKWEVQSSKDEPRPADPKLCTSSFVQLTSDFVLRTSYFALFRTKCQKSGWRDLHKTSSYDHFLRVTFFTGIYFYKIDAFGKIGKIKLIRYLPVENGDR